MTIQDNTNPVELFRERLTGRGIPLTIQRRRTYEVLLGRSDHPTADQIYDDVHAILPGVSRMTVYRVLDLLVQLHLISRVAHPGAAARYDPNLRQHHHLVCIQCSQLIDFEDDRLNDLAIPQEASRHGFDVCDHSVQFRGVCAKCRCRQSEEGGCDHD